MRDSFINNDGLYNYYMQAKSTNQVLRPGLSLPRRTIPHSTRGPRITTRRWVTYKVSYPHRLSKPGHQQVGFPGVDHRQHPGPDLSRRSEAIRLTPATICARRRHRIRSRWWSTTIKLNEQWSVLVGVNSPRIEDTNWNSNSGVTSSLRGKPRHAGRSIFKPIPGVSAYVAYTESLQQGPIAPSSASNAGQALEPYLATQLEAGAKTTIGKIDLNLAVFQIDKANAYTDPVTNRYSLDGRADPQRRRGHLSGQATKLTLGGGFTWLDAEITKTSPQAWPARLRSACRISSPRCSENMRSPRAGAGSACRARLHRKGMGERGQLDLDPRGVPARCRRSLRDEIHDTPTTFRVNVTNLLDERYWTNKGDDMLYTGDPRTVAFSMTMNF